MQNSLTIQEGLFTIQGTIEQDGFRVPWEVEGYSRDFEIAESRGGFFDLSHWGAVAVQGPDASDYLNRMTTLNFKTFAPAKAAYGAFLTGRAGVVALGMFRAVADGFHYLVSPGQSSVAAEHIEKYHFGERLTVADCSADWALFGVWNPPSSVRAELAMDRDAESMQLGRVQGEYGNLCFWQDVRRHSLYWVTLPRAQASAFLQWLRAHDVALLGGRLFEYHRLMCAMPRVGVEVSDKDLILEANLDLAISRNKGCYPGQEVVERIFTYGQVNRKLLPVFIEATTSEWNRLPALPFSIVQGEKKAGTVVSYLPSPVEPRQAVGLAYVHRLYWQSTVAFASEAGGVRVTLRT